MARSENIFLVLRGQAKSNLFRVTDATKHVGPRHFGGKLHLANEDTHASSRILKGPQP